MSFFETVKEFSYQKPVVEKDRLVYVADPLKAAKVKIAKEAREQISKILDGNKPQRGAVRWYEDGYVSFKMGRFPLVLNQSGKAIYAVAAGDDATAMTIIKAFAEGIEKGEFDLSINLLTALLEFKRSKELDTAELESAQVLAIEKIKDLSKGNPELLRKAIAPVLNKPE